jgi:hypothetical protein
MSYDLAARNDGNYSSKLVRQEVHEIIRAIPYVKPNGAAGFILEQGGSIYMEIDVCLVSDEGDVLEEAGSPSPEVNCINFHIPAGSADGLDSCVAIAQRIARGLNWELYDAQEDKVLETPPEEKP